MSNKTLSWILIGVGILVVIAVLLMGFLGFPSYGFGLRKIALAVLGVVVALVGVVLLPKGKKPESK